MRLLKVSNRIKTGDNLDRVQVVLSPAVNANYVISIHIKPPSSLPALYRFSH